MINVFELFAGIGACRKALINLDIDFKSLGYSEIDKWAIKSYCNIYDDTPDNNLGDIQQIEKLPEKIDLLFHGSPCQDFSIAGKREGGEKGSGTRSSLLWETLRLVEAAENKPRVIIWENVKGVLNKKNKHVFDNYLKIMSETGYTNTYKVLNSKDFGVPQNRNRIFVVSILNGSKFNFENLEKRSVRSVDEFINFNGFDESLMYLNSDAKIICEKEEYEYKERKYSVNVSNFITYLKKQKDNQNLTLTQLSELLNEPKTKVEHYFRQDKSNAIPDKKTYLKLKEILKLDDRFDLELTTYVTKKGVFDQNKRVYSSRGISPTITTSSIPKIKFERDVNSYGLSLNNFFSSLEYTEENFKQYDKLKKEITEDKNFYQWRRNYVRNCGKQCPTLTASMGMGGNNVPIIKYQNPSPYQEKALKNIGTNLKKGVSDCPKKREFNGFKEISPVLLAHDSQTNKLVSDGVKIRKLHPLECFLLMGFDELDYFKATEVCSNTQLYKQAGNSIVVNVLEAIFKELFKKQLEGER